MCRKFSRSSGVSSTSITGMVVSVGTADEAGCGMLNMSLNTGDTIERMVLWTRNSRGTSHRMVRRTMSASSAVNW